MLQEKICIHSYKGKKKFNLMMLCSMYFQKNNQEITYGFKMFSLDFNLDIWNFFFFTLIKLSLTKVLNAKSSPKCALRTDIGIVLLETH